MRCAQNSEAELVAADLAIRTEGLPALQLWDTRCWAARSTLTLRRTTRRPSGSWSPAEATPFGTWRGRTESTLLGYMNKLFLVRWFCTTAIRTRWRPTSSQRRSRAPRSGGMSASLLVMFSLPALPLRDPVRLQALETKAWGDPVQTERTSC